jgi:hypothetical protein
MQEKLLTHEQLSPVSLFFQFRCPTVGPFTLDHLPVPILGCANDFVLLATSVSDLQYLLSAVAGWYMQTELQCLAGPWTFAGNPSSVLRVPCDFGGPGRPVYDVFNMVVNCAIARLMVFAGGGHHAHEALCPVHVTFRGQTSGGCAANSLGVM